MLPGPSVESDKDLEEYVRANACHFNGSLCGSCRMARSAAEGVLDAALRVRGIRALRVVDASALPSLVCGQLNAAVTALAERAADLIADEHRLATHARQAREAEQTAYPLWAPLHLEASRSCIAAAAEEGTSANAHPSEAALEAARVVIQNHAVILRDLTSAQPRSQPELARVDASDAALVDATLREIAWRLLGCPVSGAPPVPIATSVGAAEVSAVRAQAVDYLDKRLSVPRDMSARAAAALRTVLREVAAPPRPAADSEAAAVGGDASGSSLHAKSD